MTAEDIIALLDPAPHPEGGWYRETWSAAGTGRPAGTAIYFLLRAGERSHWHRVDAAEIWHHYAGSPLVLSISETDNGPFGDNLLGPDLLSGARPQILVPAHHWQAARSTGGWTLAGCTVSPGFRFDGFDLAPPGYDIPRKDGGSGWRRAGTWRPPPDRAHSARDEGARPWPITEAFLLPCPPRRRRR